MTTHRLKIFVKYADAIMSGAKTFEIRKNDRGYKVGDKIVFDVVMNEGYAVGEAARHPLNGATYRIDYILDNFEGLAQKYASTARRTPQNFGTEGLSQMVTDEERREAIENLRCLSYMNRVRYKEEFYELLDETVMEPDTGYHEMNDVFERIADLIDRPTTTRHGKFKTKYGRETPCCEVCGYSIGDMRWNHCPKCGAAIVDD